MHCVPDGLYSDLHWPSLQSCCGRGVCSGALEAALVFLLIMHHSERAQRRAELLSHACVQGLSHRPLTLWSSRLVASAWPLLNEGHHRTDRAWLEERAHGGRGHCSSSFSLPAALRTIGARTACA